MKVKKTYRIEEETYNELVKYASDHGMTVTDALEDAIRSFIAVPDDCQTHNEEPEAALASKLIEVLRDELEVFKGQLVIKDEQIANLTRALVNAQDATKAAQVLHATEKPQLLTEQPKRSRFARLRAWFKKDEVKE